MTPNEEVLSLAPGAMRPFALCFIALSFNVVACYYFQAILKSSDGLRHLFIAGRAIPLLLLHTLPLASADLLWYVMPLTEFTTAILSAVLMIRYTKNLGKTPMVLKN
jgi:Na+-driven multidrug efflux pump